MQRYNTTILSETDLHTAVRLFLNKERPNKPLAKNTKVIFMYNVQPNNEVTAEVREPTLGD